MDPKVSAMPFPPLPAYPSFGPLTNTENISNAKIIKNVSGKLNCVLKTTIEALNSLVIFFKTPN